ncbi:MAG: hypothetical protein ACRCVA_18215 [Phreatobacter sp.]
MTAKAQRREAGDVGTNRRPLLPAVATAGLGGLMLGSAIVFVSVGIVADMLRLGTSRDRLGVALVAALWGAPAGSFTLLWLVLRAAAPDLRTIGRVMAGAAGICALVIAAVVAAYIQTTSPPAQTIYLTYEIRLPMGAEAESAESRYAAMEILVVSGISSRSGSIGPNWSRDAAGKAVVSGKFWLSRRERAEAIVINRQQQAALRFTLALPADPSATAGFAAWRPADVSIGPTPAGTHDLQAAELRLRIDRIDEAGLY